MTLEYRQHALLRCNKRPIGNSRAPSRRRERPLRATPLLHRPACGSEPAIWRVRGQEIRAKAKRPNRTLEKTAWNRRPQLRDERLAFAATQAVLAGAQKTTSGRYVLARALRRVRGCCGLAILRAPFFRQKSHSVIMRKHADVSAIHVFGRTALVPSISHVAPAQSLCPECISMPAFETQLPENPYAHPY
jgi:hypothetical protein